MAGSPRVGILALQGDVREHEHALQRLGVDTLRVRRPEELARVDALVIPGGESTVIDKLSRTFELRDPIRAAIRGGMPMLGTCAGLIMLADTVVDAVDGQQSFGGLDAVVRRNAFGRQVDSFEAEVIAPSLGDAPMRAAFIRGPLIESVGRTATVLATLGDGRIVAAEQGNLIGLSFHPEISGEHRFHERLLRTL